jgi:hypothetical protein
MNAKTLAHTQPVDAVGARAERPVGPAPEARWYCLSREGMATLCTDEEDAKEVAAESFVLYPQSGPYRAVQMVDSAHVSPGAEAFLTPQDMADLQRLEDLFTDDQGWDLPKERMQRLAESRKELAALRQDAERYRRLAESMQGTIRLDGGPGDTRWAAPQYINWTDGGLDAAIDAAFAA